MIRISPADLGDAEVLAKLGRETFLEPHSQSAPAVDLEKYVSTSFSISRIQEELKDPDNIFHIVRWYDAIEFYRKLGFSIIGETYFRISETHSNPNHWMHVAF